MTLPLKTQPLQHEHGNTPQTDTPQTASKPKAAATEEQEKLDRAAGDMAKSAGKTEHTYDADHDIFRNM